MTNMNQISDTALCPSARSDWEGSQIFGVVGGTVENPTVTYLKKTQPLTNHVSKLGDKITPEEVFRIAAPCEEKGCQHFDGHDCKLATRVAEKLPIVTEQLPPCSIRRNCRWWQQEGISACLRCPQVITDNYDPSILAVEVALPQ
jgi:hypothetical protein